MVDFPVSVLKGADFTGQIFSSFPGGKSTWKERGQPPQTGDIFLSVSLSHNLVFRPPWRFCFFFLPWFHGCLRAGESSFINPAWLEGLQCRRVQPLALLSFGSCESRIRPPPPPTKKEKRHEHEDFFVFRKTRSSVIRYSLGFFVKKKKRRSSERMHHDAPILSHHRVSFRHPVKTKQNGLYPATETNSGGFLLVSL